MAEIHVLGQIVGASQFQNKSVFCKVIPDNKRESGGEQYENRVQFTLMKFQSMKCIEYVFNHCN